jgi:diadenosine tetraphosphate (Ap4A) HIT family hydrolase
MSTKSFAVAPQIEAASLLVSDLPLSQLRLMDDARFPWLLLVPRRPGLEEWSDLSPEDALQLSREIHTATRLLIRYAAPHKVNVASLGNLVRQMHVHVVGRNTSDAAWPGPVWGFGTSAPYSEGARQGISLRLKELLESMEPIADF